MPRCGDSYGALLIMALIMSLSYGQDCPVVDFIDCAPSGALSPSDAQYRVLSISSGLSGSELPADVSDTDDMDVLSTDDSTFSRISFEVRFNRKMASECRITSDWEITSTTATAPQCALTGTCSSSFASCTGITPSPTTLDFQIGNIRWSQPLALSTGTLKWGELLFDRKKRYAAANDDAENNVQSFFCSGENDDLDCQCCNGPDYSDCDDNGNNSSQCPTLCDVSDCDASTSSITTSMCAPANAGSGQTYMYAWGHRYTSGATTDYTCSDGNDDEDAATCTSSNAALCDRSLHPTTAFGGGVFGAQPEQMVDAYALGLVYDGCALSTTCPFDGNGVSTWSKGPSAFSDDVDDMNTCTRTNDIVQEVDVNAIRGLMDYPISTNTYRQMVSDVDGNTSGAYSKITRGAGYDYVTAMTCGYCNPDGSSSNLSATRYFQYAMTPTCTVYDMTDPGDIIPVWDASFMVTANNLVSSAITGSVGLSNPGASTTFTVTSAARDLSAQITLADALILTPPTGSAIPDGTSLVVCVPEGIEDPPFQSDIDFNFPYLQGSRFPSECKGCTPMQQPGISAQRLWYTMDYGSMMRLQGPCTTGFDAISSYMAGGINNIDGDQHHDPDTNPFSTAEYAICSDAQKHMCSPTNEYVDNAFSPFGPGIGAVPAYVSSQFERYRDAYTDWVSQGAVSSLEPLWIDYDSRYFMPDTYSPTAAVTPSMWLYLGTRYPGPSVMFVEANDDGGASAGDSDVISSFLVDVYIRDSLAAPGAQYIPSTLDMQASSLATLCPALNPLDLCDANDLSQTANVDTGTLLEICGYTVVGIQFTFVSTTDAVTVRLNLSACEASGYIPFCLSDNDACRSITNVNGVSVTSAAQVQFQNVELFFDATATANCNSPCEAVLEQCLSPSTTGPSPCTDDEWHAISSASHVSSCADTSGSVLGPVPTEGNFQGDVFCARSATSTPTMTPSSSRTPSFTPSPGSIPSSTNTHTAALPSPSPSRVMSPDASPIITATLTSTAYYDPQYDGGGSPDACGWFCDLKCLCQDDDGAFVAQCLVAPCLIIVYIILALSCLGVVACVFGCFLRRRKKKSADDTVSLTS